MELLRPSRDFMLFYEKLTILSVVINLNGEISSILFLLRLMTIRFVHYMRHSIDPIDWFGKLMVKMTSGANLLVMVLRMGMVSFPLRW